MFIFVIKSKNSIQIPEIINHFDTTGMFTVTAEFFAVLNQIKPDAKVFYTYPEVVNEVNDYLDWKAHMFVDERNPFVCYIKGDELEEAFG